MIAVALAASSAHIVSTSSNALSGGIPFAYWLNTLVALGGVALALGVIVWVFWRRAHESSLVAVWRQHYEKAQDDISRLELVLATQPQVVLRWPSGADNEMPPGPHGFGDPDVLGQGRQFLDVLGQRRYKSGGKLLEHLVRELSDDERSAFISALTALREQGEPFTMRLALGDSSGLIAEGRVLGNDVGLWLKEIAPERQEINRLKTELRATERELSLTQEILSALPLPVWRRNSELKLEWVNDAYAQAVEAASPEAVIEQGIELDRAEPELAREALRTGYATRERKYIVSGGMRRSYDIAEAPLTNGLAGFALDATAEDNALQELMRHIAAHGDTLNKLATAVAIFGPDQKLKYFNQAYANLWRLDEDWLQLGPSDSEIMDRLRDNRRLPEQADFQAWKRERLRRYTDIVEQPDEVWHLPDGRTLRMVAQPHPFGGLLYLFEDVSSLVTLESSLNRLIGVQKGTLDNLYEGVALFGSDGRLKLYNPAFVSIWHLANRSLDTEPHFDQVSSWCSVLFGDLDDWRSIRAMITEISGERRTVEGKQTRADGSVVQYAVIPLPDGATLLSFIDVSDTMAIQKALQERNEALEESDRLKSEFVGHVSYQLRTPLNTIQGFTEMLDREIFGTLNTKQHEYTGAILAASEQLMTLINDILDLATIEAGAMALDVGDIDLPSVLQSAINLASKKALDAGVTVRLDVDPRIGMIRADERRLKQVVFNLLSNSIAFTPEGGTISVGADRTGGHIRLWVSDTGAGIAPARQAVVFERFESHGTGSRRGAGLGLPLVKSIVELHGGWVSLQSEEGQGTMVIAHFPDRAALNRNAAE
ncbi:MAG TPA: ATP-binding protein [Alphaproteobacteria bacterium]|nr:ATP-binding protein [Alphaproteobacteria bacterium]